MTRLLGVCTWILGNPPLEAMANRLVQIGYGGVELFGDWRKYPVQPTRQILEKHRLSIFSFTPANVDLAHPCKIIRKKALTYYQRLLKYAAALGGGIVSCHGKVGRIRPISSQSSEERLFVEGVAILCEKAEKLGVKLALEVLNRYESHLVNTCAQALAIVKAIDSPALGILLDTYHMNIEEQNFIKAIHTAKGKLLLFHVADSNRLAPGRGHIPFAGLFTALKEINYNGPIIIECTAPGPDPFTPRKGPNWEEAVWTELAIAVDVLRGML